MPTKSEAIKSFLQLYANPALAALYNFDMECQVNVAQDDGQPIEGEYKGKRWKAWTDGAQQWKSFRIPFNAATKAEYEDSEIKFDLVKHAEGIGLTGWDWKNKVSRFFGFDFDALIGHSEKHSQKISDEQLKIVFETAKNIPWVSVRKSASGKGIHLYVSLNPVVETENHNEHAALARAILAKMSAITGFDFKSKVDIVGGNMWIWHRKAKGTDGFVCLKQAEEHLTEVPINWKDHIKVVQGAKRRLTPDFVEKVGENNFDELSGQHLIIPLDEEHKKLIEWLRIKGESTWWWDTERHMLVTHTAHIAKAHDELSMRGLFKTNSQGTDLNTQNCFCFPLSKGAWIVRRFSPGCQEESTWSQDKQGWTRCYLNKEPDLQTASRAFGGVELPNNGGFQFREAEVATKTALQLGVKIDLPVHVSAREAVLKEQKDGRLIMEVRADQHDPSKSMEGWASIGGKWKRVYETPIKTTQEMETPVCDDLIRHTVTEVERVNNGWYICAHGFWQKEPLEHVRPLLKNLGHALNLVEPIIGLCIQRSWREVNKPFQAEYPGNRDWNKRGAQLKYVPNKDVENLKYPTWMKVLTHCGKALDLSLKQNQWAQANAILTGADYLKCWIASMFQDPFGPLPYLFFFGPQDCGKSIFHEALELLFTRGYVKADQALVSQSGFNGELANGILCVVEETDLSKARQAYNRIKDWVTARTITIHEKGKTPYQLPNSTHWVQTANQHTFCPTFTGDTRITVIRVDEIDPLDLIPKMKLIEALEREASDFLGAVMSVELPDPISRLNVPVIITSEKMNLENINESLVEKFVKEHCFAVPGKMILFAEMYNKYLEWLPQELRHEWSKIKFGREFPSQYPKGTYTGNKTFIANIDWEHAHGKPLNSYTLDSKGYLVEVI